VRAVIVGAIVAMCAVARPAAAAPADDLQRARDSFRQGDFTTAIPLLTYLLYPTPRLSHAADLVEAHVLLGVCSFETGDRPTASREFEEALYLQADLTLETVLFSTAAVRFFEEQKAIITERNRLDAERRRIAEENERYKRLLASMVVIETRPYYINFVPFGAGQFQNGQPRKAIGFAAGQGVTGAVSAGIWIYLAATYGFNGTVPKDDADFVRRLEKVEIGTGIACLGLIAYGVVDSLLNYQPSVQRKADESLLPPELRRKSEPPAPAPRAPKLEPERPAPITFRLLPTPMPGGAGLALYFEF
jgi:hypothetical protein